MPSWRPGGILKTIVVEYTQHLIFELNHPQFNLTSLNFDTGLWTQRRGVLVWAFFGLPESESAPVKIGVQTETPGKFQK